MVFLYNISSFLWTRLDCGRRARRLGHKGRRGMGMMERRLRRWGEGGRVGCGESCDEVIRSAPMNRSIGHKKLQQRTQLLTRF